MLFLVGTILFAGTVDFFSVLSRLGMVVPIVLMCISVGKGMSVDAPN